MSAMRILLMGYGNPARQDDGLGPALVAEIESTGRKNVSFDANYQPSVEDAWELCQYDRVILADAAVQGPEPFSFAPLEPAESVGFSTHALRPEAVPALADRLFGRQVPTWLLGIRGYQFEPFQESPTPEARKNLASAVRFLDKLLDSWQEEEATAPR